MFLVRSAFWLTAAFLVLKPGVDIETTAMAVSGTIVDTSRQFASEQVQTIACSDVICAGGKAMAAAALSSVPTYAGPAATAGPSIPLPRRRPDLAG